MDPARLESLLMAMQKHLEQLGLSVLDLEPHCSARLLLLLVVATSCLRYCHHHHRRRPVSPSRCISHLGMFLSCTPIQNAILPSTTGQILIFRYNSCFNVDKQEELFVCWLLCFVGWQVCEDWWWLERV